MTLVDATEKKLLNLEKRRWNQGPMVWLGRGGKKNGKFLERQGGWSNGASVT